MINLDVQDSGRLPDPLRPAMRAELYRVTGDALQRAGIADAQVHREDRGDGILFVLAPTVPPQVVLGPWLEYLYQNLRHANRNARDVLRVRVGMHAGPVTADPHGRSGRAVDLACRLGNSEEAKRLLRTAPAAPLLVALSDSLHRDWVGEGVEWIEPEHYRAQAVRLPEGEQTAWFRLMGAPGKAPSAAPTGVEPPTAAVREEARSERGLEVIGDNHGSGVTVTAGAIGRVVQGGDADKEAPAVPPVTATRVRGDGHGSGISITAGSIGSISTNGEGGQP
ncbi:hypothetical protein [Kitasatospora viridis]|uniref:hypothetical protein n=1 Tax=Kitasatospora viridis TaxID=281105 RepID=UPI0011A6CE41|nr:hypothetical protein [Kitasatospora viridis]